MVVLNKIPDSVKNFVNNSYGLVCLAQLQWAKAAAFFSKASLNEQMVKKTFARLAN